MLFIFPEPQTRKRDKIQFHADTFIHRGGIVSSLVLVLYDLAWPVL